jgi:eukaryotic-like serine/threonine-protein kinase
MVAMNSIGRYRLVRRIGAGSFATVWLGHDDDLDVPVAVKVLADNWASNNDVRNRFLWEARIMRRIHDRRLVPVYDIGTLDDGRPYFVMDYINGGSMNDLRSQGIDPVRALQLCAEACRALDVLHLHEIIHRDVTPGNLLLSRTGNGHAQVLIADLGVAKSMLDAVGATMTAGTPSYMAPEQAMGVASLDRRADIYSLTAVTYAMLTGHPPFLVRSIADILARDPSQPPVPIAERLGAPPTLDGVMLSGLAADRNRRPPTAMLLAEGLETIASQMEAAGTSRLASKGSGITPPTPRPVPPTATEAGLLPATALDPSFFPPQESSSGSHLGSGNPYPTSQLTTRRPKVLTPSRSMSYYVLLGVSALALFAISMFLTILVLS